MRVFLGFLTNAPVSIHGYDYYDGVIYAPFPSYEIIEKYNPTDVLVLANCSSVHLHKNNTNILYRKSRKKNNLFRAIVNSGKEFEVGLKYIRNQNKCNYGIIWLDESITRFERDPEKLKKATVFSEKHLSNLLKYYSNKNSMS